MSVNVSHNQTIKFSYMKLNGERMEVPEFIVDRVFTSSDNHEILQGFLGDTGTEARSFRIERISDLTPVEV